MVARRPAAKLAQSEADDRLLIEAAQKDPRRFGDLYEVNFARVYAFVASRVHDRDAAQDLTSDVFHKALANLSRFEWRDRKSTRLNSSHDQISYAVFCLKKKKLILDHSTCDTRTT